MSIREFSLNTGSWSTYINRMEEYFMVNEVPDELRVPILIACVGDATYKLMVDLCNPKIPEDVTYHDLIFLVQKHIQAPPSILAERLKFRNRIQNSNETVTQFATALKHLARTCNFKNNLDENLRDQFICGLRSEPIREQLFCEDNITYAIAFQKTLCLEYALKNATSSLKQNLRNPNRATVPNTKYEVLCTVPKGIKSEHGGHSRQSKLDFATIPTSFQYCGDKNDSAKTCAPYLCQACLRRWRICHSRNKESKVFSSDIDEIQHSAAYNAGQQECSEGNRIMNRKGQNMVRLRSGHEPVLAEVTVAGYRLRMQVDTGTPVACISEDTYKRILLGNLPINKDDLRLTGYDGNLIKTLGFVNVSVSYGATTKNLKLYVIRNGGVSLLGREWLKELNINIMVGNSLLNFKNSSKPTAHRTEPSDNGCLAMISNKISKLRGNGRRRPV